MYNVSLKWKWDNKNLLDYTVTTAVKTAVAGADKKAREEERAKAEKEKEEIVQKLKSLLKSLQ